MQEEDTSGRYKTQLNLTRDFPLSIYSDNLSCKTTGSLFYGFQGCGIFLSFCMNNSFVFVTIATAGDDIEKLVAVIAQLLYRLSKREFLVAVGSGFTFRVT